MAATVGSLAAIITADSADFDKKIGGVQAKIIDTSKVVNASSGVWGNLKKAGSSALDGIDAAVKGAFAGVVSAIMNPVGTLIGAFGLVTAGFKLLKSTLAGEQFTSILAITKVADRLGVTTEAMSGLEYAAKRSGVATEDFQRGMDILARKLGAVREESALGAGSTVELGGDLDMAAAKAGRTTQAINALGLNAQRLASLPLDESLKIIANRFQELPAGAERSVMAFQLFGKGGAMLSSLLAKGGEGIDKFQAQAKRMGLTFSREDAASIQIAKGALADVDALFGGIKRQLAIASAPFLQVIAEWLGKIVASGPGITPIIQTVVSVVIDLADAFLDAAQSLKLLVKSGEALKPSTYTNILKSPVTGLGNALTTGLAVTGETPDDFGPVRKTLAEARERAAALAKKATAGQGLGSGLGAGLGLSELEQSVAKVTDSLAQQIEVYGMVGARLEVFKLQQDGASTSALAAASAYARQLDALQRVDETRSRGLGIFDDYNQKWEKLNRLLQDGTLTADGAEAGYRKLNDAFRKSEVDRAGEIFAGTLTPLGKFTSQIGEANAMLQRGTLDADTYSRYVGKLALDFNKLSEAKPPPFLEQGSKELASLMVQNAAADHGVDAVEAIKAALEAQKRIEQEQLVQQRAIAEALRRGIVIPVPQGF